MQVAPDYIDPLYLSTPFPFLLPFLDFLLLFTLCFIKIKIKLKRVYVCMYDAYTSQCLRWMDWVLQTALIVSHYLLLRS